MAMDLLCQEMRDACQESSESLGSPCLLCSQCLEGGSRTCRSGSWLAARKVHCHSMRKLFSPRTGCDRKERSVVRQCWRQAEVAKEGSEESELVRLALILSEQFVFLNYLCLPRNEVGPNFRT